MFLEICMQIHSVVFAFSRQINKQKVCENNRCAGNKVFVKCQGEGGVFHPNTPLAYALPRMQRSGDARGDCLIGCPLPSSSIEQWPMVVIATGYKLFVRSQSRHIQVRKIHVQGRRSSGRAGGAVIELRAMETYEKQKNRYQLCFFFCSSKMLTSK